MLHPGAGALITAYELIRQDGFDRCAQIFSRYRLAIPGTAVIQLTPIDQLPRLVEQKKSGYRLP